MTREDHLITILAEECMEVAQRATKALRFGLEEIQPGQQLTNAERILYEYADLLAVARMMIDEKLLPSKDLYEMIKNKKDKVNKYIQYSQQVGRLE